MMLAALASQPVGGQAAASTGGGTWHDYVGVRVESAEPQASHKEPLVRLAAATDDRLPTSTVTKFASSESGSFFGEATAKVVIGADDRLAGCKTEKATIRRGFGKTQRPAAPLAIDVCPLLRTSANFRHAIDLNGQPVATTAKVSVFFSHRDSLPPPVTLLQSRTSGHVLTDTGRWLDRPFWANLTSPDVLVIAPPDWSATLEDRHDISKAARVGVKLKLTASMGIGSIESCKIVLASGDARFDAAVCKALLSTSYSEYRGPATNGTHDDDDAYPVLVTWNGQSVDMVALALPDVPHLPMDVPLTVAEKPSGALPQSRVILTQIILDSDARSTVCSVIRSSRDDRWDAAGCGIALQRANFSASTVGFGGPAKGLDAAV